MWIGGNYGDDRLAKPYDFKNKMNEQKISSFQQKEYLHGII